MIRMRRATESGSLSCSEGSVTPTGPDRPPKGSAPATAPAPAPAVPVPVPVRGEADEDEAVGCAALDALEVTDFTAEAFEPASTRSLRVFVSAPTTRTTVACTMMDEMHDL